MRAIRRFIYVWWLVITVTPVLFLFFLPVVMLTGMGILEHDNDLFNPVDLDGSWCWWSH